MLCICQQINSERDLGVLLDLFDESKENPWSKVAPGSDILAARPAVNVWELNAGLEYQEGRK